MGSYISAELRRAVAERADYLCEYCLIHEEDTVFGCQVDHIISEKHNGETSIDNLAYACTCCNRSKGSDIGSIAQDKRTYTRFFNPRLDLWRQHFRLDGIRIVVLSDVGEVTARILGINNADRLLEREALYAVGRYPNSAAVSRIAGDL